MARRGNVAPDISGADPYILLGLRRGSTDDEVRAAWKKTALKTHPDKCGDDGTQFRKAKAAYEALVPADTADERFTYDHSRRRSESQRRRRAPGRLGRWGRAGGAVLQADRLPGSLRRR